MWNAGRIVDPHAMAPPPHFTSTSVPLRRRGLRVWLALLLAMAVLTAPIATLAATVWSGPKLVFTKASGSDPNQAANQDHLTSNVWLTRGVSQGLYNVTRESTFTHSASPTDTEWASGTTANYLALKYTDWETWAKNMGGPPSTTGVNAVLHLKSDDIYLDIKFLSWSERPANGGGFSYERSTGVIAAPPSYLISICLFNWAERTFPQYFAPAGAASLTLTGTPFYYRYYSDTRNYLASNSADNHLYALGIATGGSLLDLGPMTDFIPAAGCSP